MFGIDRMDTEKDLTVLYYNMGATDTEVSVVRYSAITDKTKAFEHVEVLGEGFDATLGGNVLFDCGVHSDVDTLLVRQALLSWSWYGFGGPWLPTLPSQQHGTSLLLVLKTLRVYRGC